MHRAAFQSPLRCLASFSPRAKTAANDKINRCHENCRRQLPVSFNLMVMFPDKTSSRLPRLLPRLQTKLSLPLRQQRPRTMVSICFRAVVRSVRLV